jgi:hypothetical protein
MYVQADRSFHRVHPVATGKAAGLRVMLAKRRVVASDVLPPSKGKCRLNPFRDNTLVSSEHGSACGIISQ